MTRVRSTVATTGVQLDQFEKGDVYIDYPFEDAKFRYDKQTNKVYRRFYGQREVEIRPDSDLYNQAILSGRQITRDEYYAGSAQPALDKRGPDD